MSILSLSPSTSCYSTIRESGRVEFLSQDFEDEWRYSGVANPVMATWPISFTEIQKVKPLFADYLSFISCFDVDVPVALLPPRKSQIKQQSALGALKAYSLVTERAYDQSITIHRLVRLAVRNRLNSGGALRD